MIEEIVYMPNEPVYEGDDALELGKEGMLREHKRWVKDRILFIHFIMKEFRGIIPDNPELRLQEEYEALLAEAERLSLPTDCETLLKEIIG